MSLLQDANRKTEFSLSKDENSSFVVKLEFWKLNARIRISAQKCLRDENSSFEVCSVGTRRPAEISEEF